MTLENNVHEVTRYVADDGTEFADQRAAERHEATAERKARIDAYIEEFHPGVRRKTATDLRAELERWEIYCYDQTQAADEWQTDHDRAEAAE